MFRVDYTAPAPFGGRAGTVTATRDQLTAAWGAGEPQHYADEKVTVEWRFRSPNGQTVTVRDYWWNAADEWSVVVANMCPPELCGAGAELERQRKDFHTAAAGLLDEFIAWSPFPACHGRRDS